MTMTEILLAVIALTASACALLAVRKVRDTFDELNVQMQILQKQVRILSDTNKAIRDIDGEIFDALDKKLERRIKYIDNKHEHLRAVVMEHIQTEGEEKHERMEV